MTAWLAEVQGTFTQAWPLIYRVTPAVWAVLGADGGFLAGLRGYRKLGLENTKLQRENTLLQHQLDDRSSELERQALEYDKLQREVEKLDLEISSALRRGATPRPNRRPAAASSSPTLAAWSRRSRAC
ncbi:hypothetical protein [Burkholderia vietnamiensis]|uniref:hypothetical protein n=1 Tax=Burkholderia vietnamiensis TaxID=60552 RepID=UPI001594C090|nr:hypothetical protein [Burkholderia vietnamiensis]